MTAIAEVRGMLPTAQELIPWTDRAGRFSALRAVVLAAILAPALSLAVRAGLGDLGPRALTAAIHDTGLWAIRFLLISLLVTPLRSLARWPQAVAVRRMLGLGALGYVLLHAVIYLADQRYDLVKVAREIALRTYLTIGFAALLGLIVLGLTSTDGMIRRLGSQRWNRLHAITYVLAVLAFVHFALQRKLDVAEPMLMAGLYVWLMGWRVLHWRGWGRPAGLALLSIGTGLATMALEAGWHAVRNGVPFDRILAANLDFELMIRPGWWVLAAGLTATALAMARGTLTRLPTAGASPSPT
jgi:sulfoxide reductase heme-binding subunit YedZ